MPIMTQIPVPLDSISPSISAAFVTCSPTLDMTITGIAASRSA
jgi:hypothetical protein